MSARVVGLDLSITATGVATIAGTTHTITHKVAGDTRLVDIVDVIAKATDRAGLVVIEDLPTHARAAGITGMVHGAVRTMLLRSFVPYALITPATLKKYATGKGNADKTAMALAAFKRGGVEFADDNQCDAWWLRAAGLAYLGYPPVDLPAVQQDALTKVAWPPMAASVMPFAPAGTHRGAVTAHVPGGEVA